MPKTCRLCGDGGEKHPRRVLFCWSCSSHMPYDTNYIVEKLLERIEKIEQSLHMGRATKKNKKER